MNKWPSYDNDPRIPTLVATYWADSIAFENGKWVYSNCDGDQFTFASFDECARDFALEIGVINQELDWGVPT